MLEIRLRTNLKQRLNSMEQIKNLPNPLKDKLSKALAQADDKTVIRLLEDHNIDPDSILDPEISQTILHKAVNPLSDFHGSEKHIKIIDYLIVNEVDPNLKNVNGFNPLHIALEYHSLAQVALSLIISGKADINAVERHGNNLIFTAIREYGKTWRAEQQDVNKLRLKIIQELLIRGADLDMVNNHGISSRKWLEIYKDERLNKLIKQYG